MPRMHVVVLGAGYAGIAATRRLESGLPEDVALTLVDDTGEHEIQHEIHRIVRYPGLATDLRIPVDQLTSRAKPVKATVAAVNTETGLIELADTADLKADYLLVCLGAVSAEYDIPGIAAYGQPCKSVADAIDIHQQMADLPKDGQVVIGGAGLSGVQLAGEIGAYCQAEKQGSVVLLEQLGTVAPSFPDHFGRAIQTALASYPVEVMTDSSIVGVDELNISLDRGESIPYDRFIWTGGIRGPDAISGHRWAVNADLRVTDRTFVAGDAAAAIDERGEPIPAAAQTAVRAGRIAATNIIRLVEAADSDLVFEPRLDRYRYDPPGWFVSIGDETIGLIGEQVVTGSAASAAKATVGAGYLTSIGKIDHAIAQVRSKMQ